MCEVSLNFTKHRKVGRYSLYELYNDIMPIRMPLMFINHNCTVHTLQQED
jgi:hypothetical protein